jgi:hypothetical protein
MWPLGQVAAGPPVVHRNRMGLFTDYPWALSMEAEAGKVIISYTAWLKLLFQ